MFLSPFPYTALKDGPIVAAAKRAQVDYLVSLNRRHLVGVAEVAQRSGVSFWRNYGSGQATTKRSAKEALVRSKGRMGNTEGKEIVLLPEAVTNAANCAQPLGMVGIDFDLSPQIADVYL